MSPRTQLMSLLLVRSIVSQVSFEKFRFSVIESRGGIHLQATWPERCIASGKTEFQYSRKWLLSPAMTRSEIVQTCFKLALTAVEHRTRETFMYKGKRIFGPHFDVDELHRLCRDGGFDVRTKEGRDHG